MHTLLKCKQCQHCVVVAQCACSMPVPLQSSLHRHSMRLAIICRASNDPKGYIFLSYTDNILTCADNVFILCVGHFSGVWKLRLCSCSFTLLTTELKKKLRVKWQILLKWLQHAQIQMASLYWQVHVSVNVVCIDPFKILQFFKIAHLHVILPCHQWWVELDGRLAFGMGDSLHLM